MIRLQTVLTEIFSENPVLQLGFHEKLFNLTQLARYIQPLVETRAKKPLTVPAIVMALSRLQREGISAVPQRSNFQIENITVHSKLMTYTFAKTPEVEAAMGTLHVEIRKRDGYLTFSESTSQLTLITDLENEAIIEKLLPMTPLFVHKEVSSVGIAFDKKYLEFPGMLYMILQQVSLQNINIIEIASTLTEVVIYTEEKSAKLAFDTLYHLFK